MAKKGASKKQYSLESNFAYDLIDFCLKKYELKHFMLDLLIKRDEAKVKKQTPTPFCTHLGEAVLVLSTANRLKFKVRFDENYKYIRDNNKNLYRFVSTFCREVYAEGYFSQFLVVYGFLVDLLVYLSIKKEDTYATRLADLYDVIFSVILKEKFLERGGWTELKRNARPWWHIYRNSTNKDDFHLPYLELLNEQLTHSVIGSIEILTSEAHEDLGHPDDVDSIGAGSSPRRLPSANSLSPEDRAKAACWKNACQLLCLQKVTPSQNQNLPKACLHRELKIVAFGDFLQTASKESSSSFQKLISTVTQGGSVKPKQEYERVYVPRANITQLLFAAPASSALPVPPESPLQNIASGSRIPSLQNLELCDQSAPKDSVPQDVAHKKKSEGGARRSNLSRLEEKKQRIRQFRKSPKKE